MVDFVRASVIQVFALQKDACAALARRQAFGKEDGAGAADVVGVQVIQFFLEGGGFAHFFVSVVDTVHDGFEFWRNQLAAVFAKVALVVGHRQKVSLHVFFLSVNKSEGVGFSHQLLDQHLMDVADFFNHSSEFSSVNNHLASSTAFR